MQVLVRPILALAALIRGFFASTRGVPELETLPDGWRGRFALASFLFAAWCSAQAQQPGNESMPAKKKLQRTPPRVTCYKVASPIKPWFRTLSPEFKEVLRAIWLSLDAKRGKEFRDKVEDGARRGQFQGSIGKLMILAFEELSNHRDLTRGESRITCYEPTVWGGHIYKARENALVQLELLRKAKTKGQVDEMTAKRAKEVLAQELVFLTLAKDHTGMEGGLKFVKDYEDGKLLPGTFEYDAAAIIVDLEKGP